MTTYKSEDAQTLAQCTGLNDLTIDDCWYLITPWDGGWYVRPVDSQILEMDADCATLREAIEWCDDGDNNLWVCIVDTDGNKHFTLTGV